MDNYYQLVQDQNRGQHGDGEAAHRCIQGFSTTGEIFIEQRGLEGILRR